MNRERLVLLISLLTLFSVMTVVLIWSHVFTAQEFFRAGTRPTANQPKVVEPELPPIRGIDPVRGSADPEAVTIVEFADFNCEYCRLTYQEFKKAFALTSTPVRFVWRVFPVDLRNQATMLTATAANCANQQRKFWQVYDRLFTMTNPTTDSIAKLAQDAGLNMPVFNQCMDSKDQQTFLQNEVDLATHYRITGAPTIFIGKKVFTGFISAEEIRTAINNEYKK